MVTYTRCSDSVLCAPLILDAVILVDFFLNGETKAVDISKALGYLFKVPEGDCKGEDPGFGWQMNRLRQELDNAKERMEAKMKPMTEVPTPSKKKVRGVEERSDELEIRQLCASRPKIILN